MKGLVAPTPLDPGTGPGCGLGYPASHCTAPAPKCQHPQPGPWAPWDQSQAWFLPVLPQAPHTGRICGQKKAWEPGGGLLLPSRFWCTHPNLPIPIGPSHLRQDSNPWLCLVLEWKASSVLLQSSTTYSVFILWKKEKKHLHMIPLLSKWVGRGGL